MLITPQNERIPNYRTRSQKDTVQLICRQGFKLVTQPKYMAFSFLADRVNGIARNNRKSAEVTT